MNIPRPFSMVLLLALGASAGAAQDWWDELGGALAWNDDRGYLRARVSGTADLEYYAFDRPAPALIETESDRLVNPRLTVFFDAQAGAHVYGFAQARLDRGFDPSGKGATARLDEYAVRLMPWEDGRLNLQVGRFASVVGNWIQRHGSWSDPFITAPLVYENLTGMWDSAPVPDMDVLLEWAHLTPSPLQDTVADKNLRLPVIWGPSYATGAAVSGRAGRVEWAAEIKNASLSSRPEEWSVSQRAWRHPTFSGRAGFRPDARWNFGASASTGSYLREDAPPAAPGGAGHSEARQIAFAADASFAWKRWQFWTEVWHSTFEIPGLDDVSTRAWFAEVKYRWSPAWSAAVRINRQDFSTIVDGSGRTRPWGEDVWRIDLAPSWRFSAQVQLKLQYSHEWRERDRVMHSDRWATQLTLRF